MDIPKILMTPSEHIISQFSSAPTLYAFIKQISGSTELRIWKVAGRPRKEMQNDRKNVSFDMVKDGLAKYQGTYLSAENGLKLCQKYDLHDLARRLQEILNEYGYPQGNAL